MGGFTKHFTKHLYWGANEKGRESTGERRRGRRKEALSSSQRLVSSIFILFYISPRHFFFVSLLFYDEDIPPLPMGSFFSNASRLVVCIFLECIPFLRVSEPRGKDEVAKKKNKKNKKKAKKHLIACSSVLHCISTLLQWTSKKGCLVTQCNILYYTKTHSLYIHDPSIPPRLQIIISL